LAQIATRCLDALSRLICGFRKVFFAVLQRCQWLFENRMGSVLQTSFPTSKFSCSIDLYGNDTHLVWDQYLALLCTAANTSGLLDVLVTLWQQRSNLHRYAYTASLAQYYVVPTT